MSILDHPLLYLLNAGPRRLSQHFNFSNVTIKRDNIEMSDSLIKGNNDFISRDVYQLFPLRLRLRLRTSQWQTIWLQLLVHGMDIIDVICSNENMFQSNFSVQNYKYSSRSTHSPSFILLLQKYSTLPVLVPKFRGGMHPRIPSAGYATGYDLFLFLKI